jgi:hypothetical protein
MARRSPSLSGYSALEGCLQVVQNDEGVGEQQAYLELSHDAGLTSKPAAYGCACFQEF